MASVAIFYYGLGWLANLIRRIREYLHWGRIMELVEVRVQTAITRPITAWLERNRVEAKSI